jgi:uncharacterized protein (TIGR02594 family)
MAIKKAQVYLVRAGDSLEGVADYFGCKPSVITALNQHLTDEEMFSPGVFLVVPPTPKRQRASLHAKLARGHVEPAAAGSTLALEPPWMVVARREAESDVRELPGAAANSKIVEYLTSVTTLDPKLQKSDETSWCACFVNWCFLQAGVAPRDSAWALSWKAWGRSAGSPAPAGAVAVFSRGTVGGHVGFLASPYKPGDATLSVLGGNQGNRVRVSDYPVSGLLGSTQYKLVGVRWPKG